MTDHRFHLISTDGINEVQREQIQVAIEEHAADWWHHHENVWIARTDSDENVTRWRELLAPIFHQPPSSILVLRLDPRGGWAGRAPGGIEKNLGSEWLKDSYIRLIREQLDMKELGS